MHETLYFAICTGLGVRQLGGRGFGDFVLLSRFTGVAIGARHIHNTAHLRKCFKYTRFGSFKGSPQPERSSEHGSQTRLPAALAKG